MAKGGLAIGGLGFKVELDDSAFEKLKKDGTGACTQLAIAAKESSKEINKSFQETFGDKLLAGINIAKIAIMGFGVIVGGVTSTLYRWSNRGAEVAKSMLAPALAISAEEGLSLAESLKVVESNLGKVVASASILPEEAAKLLFWYERMAGTTDNFAENMTQISKVSFNLGENFSDLANTTMEWAKAFEIDIPSSLNKITSSFGYIMSTAHASLADIKMIGTWLLPMWSTEFGTSLHSLQSMLAVVATLAEKGTGNPIQARAIEKTIRDLLDPSTELLAIMSQYGIKLFEGSSKAASFESYMGKGGKALNGLYKTQDKLVRSLAKGNISQDEYDKQISNINLKVQRQKGLIEDVHDAMARVGVKTKDPLFLMEELGKVQEKLGADSSEWGRIVEQIGKGSGAGLVNMAIRLSKEFTEVRAKMQSAAEEWDKQMQAAPETTSVWHLGKLIHQLDWFKSQVGRKLGEPLKIGIFSGLLEAMTGINAKVDTGKLGKRLEDLGKAWGRLAKDKLAPAMKDIAEIVTIGLMPFEERTPEEEARFEKAKAGVVERWNLMLEYCKSILIPIANTIGEAIADGIMNGFIKGVNNALAYPWKTILDQYQDKFNENTGKWEKPKSLSYFGVDVPIKTDYDSPNYPASKKTGNLLTGDSKKDYKLIYDLFSKSNKSSDNELTSISKVASAIEDYVQTDIGANYKIIKKLSQLETELDDARKQIRGMQGAK